MANPNGELESTIIGIILILGSAASLFWAVAPWQPASAGIVIGLYLMVPKRMQRITNALKSIFGKDNS